MLGIYKMNQFHWVSNVEFEHLLHMIQNICWIVATSTITIVKTNTKLWLKLVFIIDIGEKQVSCHVLYKCTILVTSFDLILNSSPL